MIGPHVGNADCCVQVRPTEDGRGNGAYACNAITAGTCIGNSPNLWYFQSYITSSIVTCYLITAAVLCCAVLCCAVLCCAVLCCAALRCAALCCAVLCCAVLCCAVLKTLYLQGIMRERCWMNRNTGSGILMGGCVL